MNKQSKLKNFKQSLMLFLAAFGLLVATQNGLAAEQIIALTADECEVTLSTPDGNGCENSRCDGVPGCVCVAKRDHIKWTLAGGEKFKLKFLSKSPLKDNCGKNFKKDKRKCPVKETVVKGQSFSYDVILENCADGTDPRIVIR